MTDNMPGLRSPARLLRLMAGMVLALLALTVVAAADAPLPALTGRVVDDANILDPQTKAALEQRLADFEAKTSDQVAVVTVPSLDGDDIDDFSNRLFRSWALGQKKENNGALLVVAPNDRKVRIEVGYGLEGTLTDALSSIIIRNGIIPAFRQGDYSGGISKGVEGMLAVLGGDGADIKAQAQQEAQAQSSGGGIDWVSLIFLAFWLFIFFGGLFFSLLSRIFGRKIGPGRYQWLGMTTGGSAARGALAGYGTGLILGGGGFGGGGFGGGGGFDGGGFMGGGGSSGGGGASASW